jgi:hypothetical protein
MQADRSKATILAKNSRMTDVWFYISSPSPQFNIVLRNYNSCTHLAQHYCDRNNIEWGCVCVCGGEGGGSYHTYKMQHKWIYGKTSANVQSFYMFLAKIVVIPNKRDVSTDI